MSEPFTCFRCGDGYTPLYCLNCATTVLGRSLAVATGSGWVPISERKPTEADMPVMVLEEPTKNNRQGNPNHAPLEISVVFHVAWFDDDNLDENGIRYWWPTNPPPLPAPNAADVGRAGNGGKRQSQP